MTYKNSRIVLTSSIIMLLVFVPIAQSIPAAKATSASTGILIPLYSYPYDFFGSFVWKPVNDTKNNHPQVPLFVVINPNSGPGSSKDPNYAKGIANLTKSGIVVLGYVYTSYGTRSTSAVEADIDSYKSWYQANGLKGIMFDEMNNTSGKENYYQTLTNYAKGTDGFTYTIGNPGTSTLESYVGTVDTLNINETGSLPTISNLQTDTFATGGGYDKHNFSFLAYNQILLPNKQTIGNYSNFVGYMYITDDTSLDGNPWDTLASYLSTLAADLDKPTAIITINSENSAGTPITGYFVGMTQNGNQIPSGYTPLPYNGTTGVKYHFIPNSFNGCNFDHWKDTNSTTPDRTILVNSSSVAFTAVYSGTC